MNKLKLMLEIAKLSLYGKLKLTTTRLSSDLGCSQQSVSYMLKRLSEDGYILKNRANDGLVVELTKKGREFLREIYWQLHSQMSQKRVFKGTVFSGYGEGKYYMSLAGYKRQLALKLGFVPFPGTLNIYINEDEKKHLFDSLNWVEIGGFKTNKRSYGRLMAAKLSAYSKKRKKPLTAAAIIPNRTHYKEGVVELIAGACLRDKLLVKDKALIYLIP